MTIELTDEVREVNGVRCRVWRGMTEAGADCDVLVYGLVVPATPMYAEFSELFVTRATVPADEWASNEDYPRGSE